MSRWGNHEEDSKINLALLVEEHSNAYELLQVPDLVTNVKCGSSKFTKKIIQPQYQHILYQFFQMAINPDQYMKNHSKKLDKNMTYGAVQILTNLSEEFIQTIFDQEETQEDQVVQNQKQFPIVNKIFKTLTPTVTQTGLAYLSKIITPFIYQRPAEMLKVVNKPIIEILIKYFWSPSIAQLVTKIIQAEGQNDFYLNEKLQFVHNFCHQFSQVKNEDHLEKIIQSFAGIIDSFVQKHQDKYQRSKYAELLQKIIGQEDNFAFLLSHLEKFNHHPIIKAQILTCIYSYLRIHQPPKQGSKIHQQNSESIKLNQNFKGRLRLYLQNHPPQDFASPFRKQLLQFYKIIKILLIIDPESSQHIITQQFIKDTFLLMKQDPHNNILHNFQKDVLVSAINNSVSVCNILQNEVGFDDTLRSNISSNNSKISYETQLFLIGQAVKTKAQQSSSLSEGWNDLDEAINNKRQFYSVIIGGKPGQNLGKWDDFDNQLILKPLEQKNLQQKKDDKNKQAYQLVNRLDELEGTQVLSEEQEDPFDEKNAQNSHYIDDLNMPDLPLDSDRSEEQDIKDLKLESSEDLPDLLEKSSTGQKKDQKTSNQEQKVVEPQIQKKEESKTEVDSLSQREPIRANSIVDIVIPSPTPKINIQKEDESAFTSPSNNNQENKPKSPNKLDIIEQQVSQLSKSVNIDSQHSEQKSLEKYQSVLGEKSEDKQKQTQKVKKQVQQVHKTQQKSQQQKIGNEQNDKIEAKQNEKTEIEQNKKTETEEKIETQTQKVQQETKQQQKIVNQVEEQQTQEPKKQQVTESKQNVEEKPQQNCIPGKEQIEMLLLSKYKLRL